MRKELEKLDSVRMSFTATVGRYGTKKNYHGYQEATICFVNVKDEDGNVMTDHIWFTVGKRIREMNLLLNQSVKFDARVSEYRKGYFKQGFDYKLNNITKIEKINK